MREWICSDSENCKFRVVAYKSRGKISQWVIKLIEEHDDICSSTCKASKVQIENLIAFKSSIIEGHDSSRARIV